MDVRYTTFSETGMRSNNQDVCKVLVDPGQDRSLFILCDGMGGHAMGDLAAETVSNAILSYWVQHPAEEDGEAKVLNAFKAASIALYDNAVGLEMGTTLVMAGLVGNKLTIVNCGDSRCYLVRNGELLYQTQDHTALSYGWEVVTKCFFSTHPEIAQPDVVQFELQPGDRTFLCSDGVYKAMSPETLLQKLSDPRAPKVITDEIKTLCRHRSDDNYTAILAQFT